jgi:hypothetical protein
VHQHSGFFHFTDFSLFCSIMAASARGPNVD